jgi:hypothetical protein
MEAPVRNPRIESELDRTRSSPQLRTRQGARLLRSVPKFGRGERNFPTQRPDAKIQPRGGYCPAETENVKTGATIPAQRASFKSITVLEVRADCVVEVIVLEPATPSLRADNLTAHEFVTDLFAKPDMLGLLCWLQVSISDVYKP